MHVDLEVCGTLEHKEEEDMLKASYEEITIPMNTNAHADLKLLHSFSSSKPMLSYIDLKDDKNPMSSSSTISSASKKVCKLIKIKVYVLIQIIPAMDKK